MNIAVDGLRTSAEDWEAVRNLSREQLPQLTEQQHEVARKLKVSEEDYARSALAGERTRGSLLAKTERFARLIERKIHEIDAEARVREVALRTWEHRFDVEIEINGSLQDLRISEDLIDELFQSGSSDAEQKVLRILSMALPVREHR